MGSPHPQVVAVLERAARSGLPTIWDVSPFVITSYSIHYTKLYELLQLASPALPVGAFSYSQSYNFV